VQSKIRHLVDRASQFRMTHIGHDRRVRSRGAEGPKHQLRDRRQKGIYGTWLTDVVMETIDKRDEGLHRHGWPYRTTELRLRKASR
jgi:hypothetical protein